METAPVEPIRVLIAEDMQLLREALVGLLSLEPDIAVVAQAADGPSALAAAHQHRPKSRRRSPVSSRIATAHDPPPRYDQCWSGYVLRRPGDRCRERVRPDGSAEVWICGRVSRHLRIGDAEVRRELRDRRSARLPAW